MYREFLKLVEERTGYPQENWEVEHKGKSTLVTCKAEVNDMDMRVMLIFSEDLDLISIKTGYLAYAYTDSDMFKLLTALNDLNIDLVDFSFHCNDKIGNDNEVAIMVRTKCSPDPESAFNTFQMLLIMCSQSICCGSFKELLKSFKEPSGGTVSPLNVEWSPLDGMDLHFDD